MHGIPGWLPYVAPNNLVNLKAAHVARGLLAMCIHPVAIRNMPVVGITTVSRSLVCASQHICRQVALAVRNHVQLHEQ